jgi:hypothetical protein
MVLAHDFAVLYACIGVGVAIHIGIGNFGGAISSAVYRTKDQPRYVLGRE